MKTVFVIPQMRGGGAERVISILSNNLVKRDIDVDILMTAGDDVSYKMDDRVSLCKVGGETGGNPLKILTRIKRMAEYFKANKGATIVSFGPGTSAYVVLAMILSGCRRGNERTKLVISERNDPKACPHPMLRNFVYGMADKLVFQTYQAQNSFPKKLSDKGVVIPNPIKNELPEPYAGEREKTVVAVGRLEEQKNYPLLLEAFSEFHKEHNDYTLHIYGKGYLEEELKRLAKETYKLSVNYKSNDTDKLNDASVIFEGFKDNVNDCIRKAGMYVLSSDYEGISNALIEALAMGIPTISTDCPIGGSSMCIEDGVSGLLVPVGDAAKLAEAMKKLAEDDVYANSLGQKASEIRNKYDENTITECWIAIIK